MLSRLKLSNTDQGFINVVVIIIVVVLVLGGGAYVFLHSSPKGPMSNQKQPATTQSANGSFNFDDCVKQHQQPGQDPHVATDACVTLQNQASAQSKAQSTKNPQDALSTDPVTKGKYLSDMHCSGTGSVPLTSAPMHPSDISLIEPYGGVFQGGHVTPVDHEYYYQKNTSAPADTYDVLAPADGTIVSIEHRTQNVGDSNATGKNAPTSQYRIVISYSCTFLSYYDLLTSLDKSITDQVPTAVDGNLSGKTISVKAGQVIGHIGGESLDFAVWDTTKNLKGLLYPIAYASGEPWKINVVPPLDYFTDTVKNQILPFYVRTVTPRDGKLDYDVSGKAIGNWFLAGTNGYAGSLTGTSSPTYYRGHLAFLYDYVDPGAIVISIGDFGGKALPFSVKGNAPDPATIGVSQTPTKYELINLSETGNTVSRQGAIAGTILIQLTDKDDMKVEVFPNKTASEVTGFDSGAKMYNRGQDAKLLPQQ